MAAPGPGEMMESPERIKARIEAEVPGATAQVVANGSPSAQHALLADNEHALAVARFLRDDPQLRLDYLSNVTGVDWPERTTKEIIKTRQVIDGIDREIQHTVDKKEPGYLEAVYHLYSVQLKQGPVVLRLRTADRAQNARLPSLTPIWRGAEFQEREIFDLFGIVFEGHPDLRRILMWEGFKDHPMRKDYVEPDDFEYEPTAHDEVLARAQTHRESARE